MKIAHVISYFQPELGYQELYLAKEQQKLGHDVCIITSDRYYPFLNFSKTVGSILKERYVGKGAFIENGIKVVRLPLIVEFAGETLFKGLIKAIADFHPDIVHVHGETSPAALMLLSLKKIYHYRVIVDCHMDYSLESKTEIRKLLFELCSRNPIWRGILRRSDGYFGVTDSVRLWLSHEWGLSRKRIEVIPLGGEIDLFSPNCNQRKEIRDQLGLNDDDILITYAGKILPEKEIETLISAVAFLIKAQKKVKLLLVGNGEKGYEDKIIGMIATYNIQNDAYLVPLQKKERLACYYNASDVGVWPGNPSITIVEAIAAGLPVIVPKSNDCYTTTLHHYVEYGNGLEFDRGNPKQLYLCLEKIVDDEGLRKEMGSKSRKLAVEKLNWTSIALMTQRLYEKALKGTN
jgi:glycosyltransferase involved in cell wall biosynthesis